MAQPSSEEVGIVTSLNIRLLAAIVALGISGCGFNGAEIALLGAPGGEIVEYPALLPGQEQGLIQKAEEHYNNGEYGLAANYYRQAVERDRSSVEALLGLASAYDHLKRFDEAEQIYSILESKIGNTVILLNNLGYHYMLKGEFGSAEHALLTAQAQDPGNSCILANLALLEDWKAAAGKTG